MRQVFAKVAVNLSTNKPIQEFIYRVPKEEAVSIGSIVVVPFRNSLKVGYVVALNKNSNIKKTKSIISVLKELNMPKESRILANWIARHYLCPKWAAARLFLPPGLNMKIKREKTNNKVNYSIRLNTKQIKYLKILKKLEKGTVLQKKIISVIKKANIIEKNKALEIANCSTSVLERLVEKGVIGVEKKSFYKTPKLDFREHYKKPANLTKEQKRALAAIKNKLKFHKKAIFLLNGVTGSGKTEVYAQAIETALKKNKSAILLVPEIAMSVQMVARLKSRFNQSVVILHSGLTISERLSQWHYIKKNNASLIIGARSAVFAPVKNLGLVIVDEEHEGAYKQNRNPRYNGRDVAIKRAFLNNSVCILGSATPSLESKYKCETREYQELKLTEKPVGSFVDIELIDMKKNDEKTLLSAKLINAIKRTLKSNLKVLLMLNRRGFSSFLLCPSCSFVAKCKRCSVSLTYHKSKNILKCHHCNYTVKAFSNCPNCGSIWLRYAGSGTQKLEKKIKDIFPNEIVIRLDKDTAKKNKAGKTLEKFKKAKKAILLGTQIIGKSFDFKDIALVGIVNADTSLNFPDFRAGERTFQLIHQVAGRSGRGKLKGAVLIQSYNSSHYAIKAALKSSYENFYFKELAFRKELNYPPYSKLINIGFYSENFKDTQNASEKLFKQLKKFSEIEVLGPCAAPIAKIKNFYRWHILIKTTHTLPKGLPKTLINFRNKNVNIAIDVDPQSLL